MKRKNEALAAIGRKGGSAKVPKGFSTRDPEELKVLARLAINKRWDTVRAAKAAASHSKEGLTNGKANKG